MAYANSSKTLSAEVLNKESRHEVIEYLKLVRHKYTDAGLRENTKDHRASLTAPIYFELVKNIGM